MLLLALVLALVALVGLAFESTRVFGLLAAVLLTWLFPVLVAALAVLVLGVCIYFEFWRRPHDLPRLPPGSD